MSRYLISIYKMISYPTCVSNYTWSSLVAISLIANLFRFRVASHGIYRTETFPRCHYTVYSRLRTFYSLPCVPLRAIFSPQIHFLPHVLHDGHARWHSPVIYKAHALSSTLPVYAWAKWFESTISAVLKINSHRSFLQHPLLRFAATTGGRPADLLHGHDHSRDWKLSPCDNDTFACEYFRGDTLDEILADRKLHLRGNISSYHCRRNENGYTSFDIKAECANWCMYTVKLRQI